MVGYWGYLSLMGQQTMDECHIPQSWNQIRTLTSLSFKHKDVRSFTISEIKLKV